MTRVVDSVVANVEGSLPANVVLHRSVLELTCQAAHQNPSAGPALLLRTDG